jgi:hypothetical protein
MDVSRGMDFHVNSLKHYIDKILEKSRGNLDFGFQIHILAGWKPR